MTFDEGIVLVDVGRRLSIGLLFHLSMRCFEAIEKNAPIIHSIGTQFKSEPTSTETSDERTAADPTEDPVYGKETIHDGNYGVRAN